MTNSKTNSNNSLLQEQRSLEEQSLSLNRVKSWYIYGLLGLFLVGYGVLTLNGYGNHDDIYRMLGTWRTLIHEHFYSPSRFQGYLIPELVIGFSAQLGGFHLSNFVSAILAVASLFIFYRLLLRITAPLIALLAVAVVGSNPYWIIPATTSTDYIYPAFFFLLGLLLFIQKQFRLAGLVFALAVSSRITYGPMVLIPFIGYLPYLRQTPALRYRFFQGLILFFLGTIALYLPVFFASGMSLSFLAFASDAAGGTLGNVARFFYKNVYLWGLPAFLVLLMVLFQERNFYWRQLARNPFRQVQGSTLLFHAVFWGFLYTELWFARLPHQYQYLLPVLFCVAYFIAILPNPRTQMISLSLVLALHLSYAFWNLDVLETYQTQGVNRTIHSDGAKIHVSIDDGVLVRDFKWRSIYQRHLTEAFNQRWQGVGEPLENPR